MFTTTRKETTVDILAQTPETFDAILKNCKNYTKEFIQQRLEIFDLDIFSSIDRKRFEVVRIDERTLLTSCGIITFKRRYYYDHENENYVYLLDNQLGIPKNVRMSNELLLKILDLASITLLILVMFLLPQTGQESKVPEAPHSLQISLGKLNPK